MDISQTDLFAGFGLGQGGGVGLVSFFKSSSTMAQSSSL